MPTTDAVTTLIAAIALLAGWAMTLAAALAAWRGWLRLRVRQERHRGQGPMRTHRPAAAMIDLADLRERIRKLEAIAAGINP